MTADEYQEFLAGRREIGKGLDPETATVFSKFVLELDSYRVIDDPEPEKICNYRRWFVSSPQMEEIEVHDLFDEMRVRLGSKSSVNCPAFDDDEIPFRL